MIEVIEVIEVIGMIVILTLSEQGEPKGKNPRISLLSLFLESLLSARPVLSLLVVT